MLEKAFGNGAKEPIFVGVEGGFARTRTLGCLTASSKRWRWAGKRRRLRDRASAAFCRLRARPRLLRGPEAELASERFSREKCIEMPVFLMFSMVFIMFSYVFHDVFHPKSMLQLASSVTALPQPCQEWLRANPRAPCMAKPSRRPGGVRAPQRPC